MTFASNRSGDHELYVATRASVDDPWAAPALLDDDGTINQVAADEQDPWISGDGRRLYFASNRDGEFDLMLATR
ncbi:MAG: hypothetical protein R2939_14420 [Kofleriaceae bacterium]